jgi:hypothetical protein
MCEHTKSSGDACPTITSHIRARSGTVLVWIVWAAASIAAIAYVQRYTRNVPYMDDFALVPAMTGHQELNLQWIWSQHNEHRPAVSRLILFGMYRFVCTDIRSGLYLNAALLSVAAASMILLARRLRGRTTVTDSVLPLSILNLGQVEIWLISFALNLLLTAWISLLLIGVVSQADRMPPRRVVLRFGLLMVLLPLCGGSGIAMLPVLMLWLGVYLSSAWWSGIRHGGWTRALGILLLLLCSLVVACYLSGYQKPGHHPNPRSVKEVLSTTTEYLSLVICPNLGQYWPAAGLLVAGLVTATVSRLAVVYRNTPSERARASGLVAIIVSMVGLAVVVGLSRSALGPGMGLSSRYITIACPLLSAMYVAWLVYGSAAARNVVHAGLLVLVCLAVRGNVRTAGFVGDYHRALYVRLERGIQAGVPVSQLVSTACPKLDPDPKMMSRAFKMLKSARIGKFAFLNDDEPSQIAAGSPGGGAKTIR